MNRLTSEQVAELTERLRERLAEFEGPMVAFPTIAPGVVRTMVDVFDQWQTEKELEEVERERERIESVSTWAFELKRGDLMPSPDPTCTPLAADPAEPEVDPLMTLAVVEGEDDRAADDASSPHYESPLRDLSDLADAWPAMPDLTGGIDRFAEHPVAGEPAPATSQQPTASSHPRPIGPTRPDGELERVRDYGKPALPEPDVARERLADALASANSNGGGELLSEAINKPRTLAEADRQAERRSPRREAIQTKGRRGNVLPTIDELVAEVKRQAMGGVMPTLAQFNQSKPSNWATATSHLQRLNISWEQLRKRAGLKQNPRAA